MIRLLVDGVAFQKRQPAPPWTGTLAHLARRADLSLLLLDRGHAPAIDGVRRLPFPAYLDREGPADSALIQQICDLHAVDVFASTGVTTPLATPTVLPLIEPAFSTDDGAALTGEAEAALAFAQAYVCATTEIAAEVQAMFPQAPADHLYVAATADPEKLAGQLAAAAACIQAESATGRYALFFSRWRHLRAVQASVDFSHAFP